ncbi:MAG: 4Fe-4S binding protein [Methanobacteriaceae archaeon]|nr:4Fe-4S binding protein [Methanobacteriaceae archaeon]
MKEESKQDPGCCGDDRDKSEVEVACGCGGDFTDESLIANPIKPEFLADAKFFEEFEKLAHLMGIVNIGYTKVSPELANPEKPLMYPQAMVLTLKMGEDIIETVPGPEAQKLNDATYAKLGTITYALSDFIRANGFATQVAHPYGGLVNFSPLGQNAGLGWIGQSGLLISPELGPRQKISAILVSIENLPVKEHSEYSWITDYCDKCGKCVKACPEKALIEQEDVCGENKIKFVKTRCIGCSQGCTYCIEDCPFDSKGYDHVKNKFDKMTAKLMEKRKGHP